MITDLFPGCSCRWEDDRPFEVEVTAALARDPGTRVRAAYLLAKAGWRVRLAPFERTAGAIAYSLVLEACPNDLPVSKVPG